MVKAVLTRDYLLIYGWPRRNSYSEMQIHTLQETTHTHIWKCLLAFFFKHRCCIHCIRQPCITEYCDPRENPGTSPDFTENMGPHINVLPLTQGAEACLSLGLSLTLEPSDNGAISPSEGSSVKESPEDKQASVPCVKGSAKISRWVTLALYTGDSIPCFFCGQYCNATKSLQKCRYTGSWYFEFS